MAHMHTQRGVGHNICYTPTKIGTIIGGSSSMETSAVRLLNAVLQSAVFQIIGIATHGKEKSVWHGSHA